MQIVFMGTPKFAVPSLHALIESEHEIQCVVTAPDKKTGRGLKITSSPVKQAATEANLPVLQPESLEDAGFIASLEDMKPHVIVVVAFRILPPQVFRIPEKGTINLHASMLPHYRGAAPINMAIINGENRTGITTFLIDEKVDTGNILLQREFPIGPEETAGELAVELAAGGADIILETLSGLEENTLKPRTQPGGKYSKAPKLTKEISIIDWSRNSESVHNLIRGLSPVPAAVSRFRGTRIKMLRSKMHEKELGKTAAPGTILSVDPKRGFIVACGAGSIEITELMQEGRKSMDARSFLAGFRGLEGDRFE